MNFSKLSLNLQALQETYNIILFFLIVYILIQLFLLKQSALIKVTVVVMMAVCYFIMQITSSCIYANNVVHKGSRFACKTMNCVPDIVWIGILSVINMMACIFVVNIERYKKNNPSYLSVKEAIDNLQNGMCYYYEGGRVLMVNRVMNIISHRISGHTVLNGEEFLKEINQYSPPGKKCILKFADGSVYTFTHKELGMKGLSVSEIIATDITEEYALSERLKYNNEKLVFQKEHLMEMGKLITDMTIQKEMLGAKIMLHDELGSALITTRRYLEGKSEQNKEDVLDVWRKCIRLLKNEEKQKKRDAYEIVFKAAKDVGIEIGITGELPRCEPAVRITVCAINECITNTIRHAHGEKIDIVISSHKECNYIVFTNDGMVPLGEIHETGGLKNLRDMIENVGGKMTVENRPRFILTLEIPNL